MAYRELTKCHVERVKRVETSFRFFDFAVAPLRMTKRLFSFKLYVLLSIIVLTLKW